MMESKSKKIAIIGGGVAGLTAAYLLYKNHEITLYEKNDYMGGHTNTIIIEDGADQDLAVDTGFIVYNDRNYPTFIKLLSKLRIEGQVSDMSFGFSNGDFEYSSYFPRGIFAQKRNLFNLSFLKMIKDILKFNDAATEDLFANKLKDISLGDYLSKQKVGDMFRDYYLIPMGAAIWSTSPQKMLDFPAENFARFFHNHGLLSIKGRPEWRTIQGGSHSYVKRVLTAIKGNYSLNSPVKSVCRKPDGVIVEDRSGNSQQYDYVIIATHADQALKLLSDPSEKEKSLLGAWKYSKNRAVLHKDDSFLPTSPFARASWNYREESESDKSKSVSVTYDMNRLQKLKTKNQYLVTLNSRKEISRDKIIREIEYTHPIYDYDSIKTQDQLPGLNGVNRTFFCGSYFNYGFHEDAVKSAVQVTEYFGETL